MTHQYHLAVNFWCDLIRRKRRDQQKKQIQEEKTSTAALTCRTRVMHATLEAQTAWASRLAVPGTPSPIKQSKQERRQQQIPSWWIPQKNKYGLWCAIWLSLSRKSSPTKCLEKKSIINLDWDDAFKDVFLPILRLHLMQTSKMGFKLKNPFALGNWRFTLAEN